MRLNKLTVSIFTFTLVFITGCLEVSVNQPTQVPAGQTVSASVQVVLSADPQIGSGDDRRMMFAVNKPTGWVIDSITYSSPEYGAGQFNYLGDAVESDDRPGGADSLWESAVETLYPSVSGMGWAMYESDTEDSTSSMLTGSNPDTINVTVNFSNTDDEGMFHLGYYVNLSNHNPADHDQIVHAPMESWTPDVVINEIMYNPLHSTGSTNDDGEFVELYNNSPVALDISGWSFVEGFSYTFPAGASIPAHGYIVVTRDSSEFFAQHGHYADYSGGWTGSLSNSGEDITIADSSGATMDSVMYDDNSSWSHTSAADGGDGFSLELKHSHMDNNLPLSWAASLIQNGTPGYARSAVVTFSVDVSDTLSSLNTTRANVYVRGNFSDMDPMGPPMRPHESDLLLLSDDDNDNVFTRMDTLLTGKHYHYTYVIVAGSDTIEAGPGDNCGPTGSSPFQPDYELDLVDPVVNPPAETVCFASCHECGWLPNLVLTLDVCQDTAPTSVEIRIIDWDLVTGTDVMGTDTMVTMIMDTVDTTHYTYTFSPYPPNPMKYQYVVNGVAENLMDDMDEGYGGCATEGGLRHWEVGHPLDLMETFSSCVPCGWTPNESNLVINEIHYNPAGAQGSDLAWEFLELVNVGNTPFNMDGVKFTQGVNHEFGAIHIQPDSFLVVAITDTLQTLGVVDTVVVWTSGALSNGGEDIELVDSNGVVLDYVDYEDGINNYGDWGRLHDGGGTSLELKKARAGSMYASIENQYADSWTSTTYRGTPGKPNKDGSEEPMITTIKEIQQTSDTLGFSDFEGKFVEVRGVITGNDEIGPVYSSFTVQDFGPDSDQPGAQQWSGIYAFFGSPELSLGDHVIVRAYVAEYRGYGSLGDPNQSMTILIAGTVEIDHHMEPMEEAPPAPRLPIAIAGSEPWEGVRVEVRGTVTATAVFDSDADDYNYGEWTLTDSTGSINVNDRYVITDPMLGMPMEVTGPINHWAGTSNTAPVWKIEPADEHDLAGPPHIVHVHDVPADQGGRVYLHFRSAYGDQAGDGSGVGYTILRFDGGPGPNNQEAVVVASGDAWGASEYAYEVSTHRDSTGNTPGQMGMTRFQVVANMPERVFLSNMAMGFSVDNIAPGIPMGLIAEAGEGQSILLTWDPVEAEDLTHYVVYRSTEANTEEWEVIGESSHASYLDEGVVPGTYTYAVEAFDAVNGSGISESSSVLLSNDGKVSFVPEEFALYENYPNPFNPVTNIVYDIPEMADVSITIFNIKGQRVNTLVQGQHQPGRYKVLWNAVNDYGQPLASGMYIYMIRAGDFTSIKKLMLLK